jgi:MoaA/NifB/PqqE/SkfB family radical SAM enzyme
MARQAKAAGAMVGFTTNATLLDRSCAVELIRSGVDIVAVSLAGVAPATHERFRPGCGLTRIDAALSVLKELKRERGVQTPRVHIAFMPSPRAGPPRARCAENVLNACFVSHRGDVSPCVFTSPSVSPGERAVHYFKGRAHEPRQLVFGNVREQTLPAIWNSEIARGFRESFQNRMAMANPGTDHLPEPCRHCYKLLEC